MIVFGWYVYDVRVHDKRIDVTILVIDLVVIQIVWLEPNVYVLGWDDLD